MLYDSTLDTSKVVTLIETERVVVVHGWGRSGDGQLFKGYRVSVLQDEKVLEVGCTAMRILNTIERYT